MANFSFVSGAKFRPFSYQEMLQPLQAYTQEYNTIQEGMGELGTKADVFDKMANEQTDPQAYTMYKQYSNDLAKQAESLAKQGLTPASRQGLIDMKRRYSSEIVPIEQAYKRRQELIDEQRKLQAQDSTLLFDRPASTLSLDELVSNPALSPQSYSGALLSKQVGTAAQNLAKEVRENPRKWRTILGNQYYETIMQKGFRPEEIMQAVQNNPEASPILQGIVEDTVGSSGIKNWNDENILNRAYDYARQGLWNAVGETQYQNLSNKAYDYAMRATARKAAGGDTHRSPRLNYSPIARTSVKDSETGKLQESIEFLKKLNANPDLLKEKAIRYKKNEARAHGATWGSYDTQETYSPNVEKLKALTSHYKTTDTNKIIKQLTSEIAGAAVRDFTYSTNFTDNSLLNEVVTRNLASMATDGNIPAFRYSDNKKGSRLSEGELAKIKPNSGFLNYDPMNNALVYIYRDSDNKLNKALLDPEVVDDKNRTLHSIQVNIDRAKAAKDYGSMNSLIDLYMQELDSKFNTLAKIQSSTDSKLNPEDYYEETDYE